MTLARHSVLILKKIKLLRVVVKPKTPRFSGWGMTSRHRLPWEGKKSTDLNGRNFAKANDLLMSKVERRQFILSVVENEHVLILGKNEQGKKFGSNLNWLTSLSWRHYIVYWTAMYSTRFTKFTKFNIVEAGVGDGMSINFAISAIQDELGKNVNFEAFLYDAWGGMKEENLTVDEKSIKGKYSYLSLEQTKSNLKDFQSSCKFIQGHIPDVIVENPGPNELSWLHIDLNSSVPTLKTLEHFVPKLLPGGVVLFDDYGHVGFRETKEVADEYCSQVSGLLLPLPTGQAVFFKQ
ncbi:MAG: class I SAM-dependent methyltransferase [Actinomycetota bacterium]|nr:class I SAM-dependent methyltransferase [Actinomycetota bacterium]